MSDQAWSPSETELGEGELRLLEQLAGILNRLTEREAVLDRLMDLFLAAMRAERGMLLAFGPAGEPRPLVVRNLSPEAVSGVTGSWSRSAIDAMAGAGRLVVSEDVLNDRRFRDAQSVVAQQIQSLLCAPLRWGGELRGALYVDSRGRSRIFSDRDVAFARALAELAAVVLERSAAVEALAVENDQLRARAGRYQYADLIGTSEAMQRLFDRLKRAVTSPAEISVLITGENGTGKTQIAKLLHRESPRRDRPFVPFGAGTVPEALAESQLFGHKKGAFTGADADRAGLVERAEGGTLFLDDVDAMPLAVQPKLLTFLQEREYRPVGGDTRRSDVRIICATNADLEALVREGRFREDLYFRLNGLVLEVPPLRERRDDILLLARHFLGHYRKSVTKDVRGFSPAALSALLACSWPGNVRQLQSEVVQALTMCGGAWIEPADFKSPELRAVPGRAAGSAGLDDGDLHLKRALDRTRERIVRAALEREQNNVSRAARAIGVSRGKFYDLLNSLGLRVDDSGPTPR